MTLPPGAGGTPEGEPNAQGTGGEGGPGGTPPEPIDQELSSRLPYTREALEAHARGVVLVTLEVDDAGVVAHARVVKGVGYGLDEIAEDLARKLRFRPARDPSGKPVAARVRWKFRFEPSH